MPDRGRLKEDRSCIKVTDVLLVLSIWPAGVNRKLSDSGRHDVLDVVQSCLHLGVCRILFCYHTTYQLRLYR